MALAPFASASAGFYDARPGYPPALLRKVGLDAPDRRWLDVAAGTGLVTSLAMRSGHTVTAVEPDPAMCAALRANHPSVPLLNLAAESISTADTGTFDVVSVGQALHYLSLSEFAGELRMVAPSGELAVFTNLPDAHGWLADILTVARSKRLRQDPAQAAWSAMSELLGREPRIGAVDHVISYDEISALRLVRSLSTYQQATNSVQDELLNTALCKHKGEKSADGLIHLKFTAFSHVWKIN